MAIAVRSSISYSGQASSFVVAEPAGLQALDRLILFVVQPGGTGITAAPTGWSAKAAVFSGGSILRTFTYTPGGSALPAPWTFSFVAADGVTPQTVNYAAAVLAIQPGPAVGGATYRPDIEVGLDATSASSTGPAVVGPVTPVSADDLLLAAVCWGHGTTFTPPSGMTEVVDAHSGTGAADMSLFVGAEGLTGGAGASTGTRSITNDNPNTQGATVFGLKLLAIKSGPPPTEWSGDLSTGNFSQYSSVEVAFTPGAAVNPIRAEVRTDDPPPGLSQYVRFTVLNGDHYPLTSTDNPRAQLNGPYLYAEGMRRWCYFKFRFPLDFPSIPYFPDGWLAFWQLYGPPFIGSPNLALAVNGEQIMLQEYGFTQLWSAPLVRGPWHSAAFLVDFSADEKVGGVSGFYNLKPMEFVNHYRWTNPAKDGLVLPGRRRYPYATLRSDNTDGLDMKPMIYHKVDIAGVPDAITMDQAGMGSGTVPPAWLTNPDALPTVRTHR